MKRFFTLIAATLSIMCAQAAEDLTLNVSETVAFGDWGFSNENAPALEVSNWAAGGGWQFATPLSQDDYCGVDFTLEPTVGAHVSFTITFESGETQSIDVPEGTTSINADFAFNGGITKIGFSHGDWEGGADPAVITIVKAVVKAHSTGEVTVLSFADLYPGEDESIKDNENQTVTLTRYSTYPCWQFEPAIASDNYEKVVITFAEPIPDEGIYLNAESADDNWSGTTIAGLTKGATKVTAYFSQKPGVDIKSVGFYYAWNSKQGTDDVTTLKIAKAELVKNPSPTVSISDAGYATFCYSAPLDLTGIEAYTAAVNGDIVALTSVEGKKIPANTPIILKGSGDVIIPITADATDEITGNELLVSDGTVTGNGSIYILANGTSGVGFYKLQSGSNLPQGKAYLQVSASAKVFYGFDDATDINMINASKAETNACYNLNGQRVSANTKGIYILNGKKVIIK